MAFCGKLEYGRPTGRARYGQEQQVQCWKDSTCAIFLIDIQDFKDIKYEATKSVQIKSLYIQRHLSQSVAVCGKLEHGRPRQSQVQPGTARYSARSPIMCYIFRKISRISRILNIILQYWEATKSVPKNCKTVFPKCVPKSVPKHIWEVGERSVPWKLCQKWLKISAVLHASLNFLREKKWDRIFISREIKIFYLKLTNFLREKKWDKISLSREIKIFYLKLLFERK